MRRADRLFAIVQALRGRRLTTAHQLAERLSVSARTIYRDVQDLSLSGVPIVGEAGVGYSLKKGFDLPPIMFDSDEIEALLIGARMVGAWGGTQLAQSAERAMEKIAAVLPENRRVILDATQIFAPSFHVNAEVGVRFEALRNAIAARQYVMMAYAAAEQSKVTMRRVRPLALYFWGERWTLAAWCEVRNDFRSFRLDRISTFEVESQVFALEAGKSLADFVRKNELEAKSGKFMSEDSRK
jgi:predicted DNA-binding transcriptional regulator YafY